MVEYDLIIIGGGCAGYPAAVYSSRYNLKTLVIVKQQGGLIATTDMVENFPGFISINGAELAKKFEDHARANEVEIIDDIVNSIEKKGKYFIVKTDLKQTEFKSKAIIYATGTRHRNLGLDSEVKFRGRGVSYCATCDGMFFRNKVVGVVGGGDSAVRDAIILAQNSKKVYLFVRSKLRAEPANIERLMKFTNVEIIYGVNVKEICGEKVVNSVILDNGSKIELNGLFIAIGLIPRSELAKSLGVEVNALGEVVIDRLNKTNIDGFFAAGDVTDFPWRQAIVAASGGSVAAHSAFNYINKHF